MRGPQLLVIGTFLLMVGTPPLVQVAVEAARGERPPVLRLFERIPTVANLRAYEKMLQDDSVTARALRPLMQAVQFFALRDAGDKALRGLGGWLFYQPGVNFLTQRSAPADSSVLDALTAVVRFRDDLAARGVRLIILPVPNKESIYPDRLAWFATPPRQAIGAETRAFLAQAGAAGVEVVDLFATFCAARQASGAPLYLEQDSHWSPRGMEMAASAVAQRVLDRGWLPRGSIDYVGRPALIHEHGDLIRMIRSPMVEAGVPPESIATTQCGRRHGMASRSPDTGSMFRSHGCRPARIRPRRSTTQCHRDQPQTSDEVGDGAKLVLALKPEVSLVARKVFDCPSTADAARKCLAIAAPWLARPSSSQAWAVIDRRHVGLKPGVTTLGCHVGEEGALSDCKVLGKATPDEEAAMRDLAASLRRRPKPGMPSRHLGRSCGFGSTGCCSDQRPTPPGPQRAETGGPLGTALTGPGYEPGIRQRRPPHKPARRIATAPRAAQSFSPSPCAMASTKLSRTTLAKGRGAPFISPALSASRTSFRPSDSLKPAGS